MNIKFTSVFSILLVCCVDLHSHTLSDWSDVMGSPSQFDGREVSLCGWFTAKMELCSLAPGPQIYKVKESIWITPKGGLCTFDQAAISPFEGWAIIKGIFHTGGDYGHFGLWDYGIEDAYVRPIDKGCKE